MTTEATSLAEITLDTPIGKILPPKGSTEKYLAMADEELKEELKRPFIDPVAYAVYRKRFFPCFA